MKLLYTPNSPYARKVRVLIRERAATQLVDEEIVQPLDEPEGFRDINPLGKIPVLIIPDEEPLVDSPLIMEYLDANLPGRAESPATGRQRWTGLRRHALADGILDAAVSTVFEKNRTDAAPSPFWLGRWRRAMLSGVAALDAAVASMPAALDCDGIAIACALGYLDFRHADLDWRASAPTLTGWHALAAARPSFTQTVPG